MAPTARTRNRVGGQETGYRKWSGLYLSESRFNLEETCKDIIGDFGGYHSLDIYSIVRSGSRYKSFYEGMDMPPDWDVPLPIYPDGKLDGIPNNPSYVNRVLAQTGPLTASVNLPVALFELRELPRMLKHAGDLLHKLISRPSGMSPAAEAASATLAYQFGWGPLIQDIGKMMDLTNIVAKRMRQMAGAHSSKGLRRSIQLDHHSASFGGTQLLSSSYGRIINQTWSDTRECKTWGSVRWTVADPNQYGKPPSFEDAFNAVLGTSKGYIPISVWKALPWSWAIDWFAGISNIINANHNMVYYKPSRVCIMRTYRNTRTYLPKYGAGNIWQISAGSLIATWKTRTVHDPVTRLRITIPFLDGFKLSILGSFTILGLKGRG